MSGTIRSPYVRSAIAPGVFTKRAPLSPQQREISWLASYPKFLQDQICAMFPGEQAKVILWISMLDFGGLPFHQRFQSEPEIKIKSVIDALRHITRPLVSSHLRHRHAQVFPLDWLRVSRRTGHTATQESPHRRREGRRENQARGEQGRERESAGMGSHTSWAVG